MMQSVLKKHVREGYRWDFSLIFLTLFSITIFSGVFSAAEEPEEDTEAVAESGPLWDSVPPLDQWDDPFAIAIKNSMSGKSPAAVGELLVDELIQAAEELTELVKSVKPDYSSYSKQMALLAKAQLKIRVLMETLHFLASQLPEDQQAAVKASARNRFASALTAADIALSTSSMMPASKEITDTVLGFSGSYVDREKLYADVVKDLAPPKPAGSSSSMGPGSMPMMMPMPMSTPMGPGSMGGQYGSGNLLNACKSFMGGYSPGPVNDKTMEPLVNALIAPARTNLQGYVPKTGSSAYGSGMGGSGMMMDYSPSMMGTPQPSQQAPQVKPSGGLNLIGGSTPSTTRPGQTRESLDDSVRQSVAFALKQMLRDENTKIGGKIAAAYCAFATEDYVPEIALFLERSERTLKLQDVELLTSLAIGTDYAKDPRVGFLMTRILFAIAPASTDLAPIIAAFEPVSSAAQFLVSGLDQPKLRDVLLFLLFKVGNGDSAIVVGKLLDDKAVETAYQINFLEILGETGDGRVGSVILKCLPNPDLRESAKDALIRIGTPAEAAVVTIFNAKRPEFDLVALEILSKIGSWKSLSKMGAQLALYGEAKTSAEAAKMEEKPKLILESTVQNELIQRTIEAGTMIVARMTDTPPPNLRNTNTSRSPYGSGMPGAGTPGGGMSSPAMVGPGMMGSGMMMGSGGMPGSYPGSPSRGKDDPKAPRTLVKKGDVPPGNAPVYWAQGLATAGSAKFDEITRIVSRATNYENGEKAGKDMRPLNWVVDYFNTAFDQVNNYCLPLANADAKKSLESSMSRIKNRYTKFTQGYNSLKKTKSPWDGFQAGYAPKGSQQQVPGGYRP